MPLLKQLVLVITALANVALNRFSNVSVPAGTVSVMEPRGEISRPPWCFSWLPGGVSQLMRLHTELCGQPLCLRDFSLFNAVMLQQPGSLPTMQCQMSCSTPDDYEAPPCFLLPFQHISSLDFKADGREAPLGSLVCREVQVFKQTT